jgi:hypothetical protein
LSSGTYRKAETPVAIAPGPHNPSPTQEDAYLDFLVDPGVSVAAPLSFDADFDCPEPLFADVEEGRVAPESFLFGFSKPLPVWLGFALLVFPVAIQPPE